MLLSVRGRGVAAPLGDDDDDDDDACVAAGSLESDIGIDDVAGGHEGGSVFNTARSANIKMKTIPCVCVSSSSEATCIRYSRTRVFRMQRTKMLVNDKWNSTQPETHLSKYDGWHITDDYDTYLCSCIVNGRLSSACAPTQIKRTGYAATRSGIEIL